MALRPISRLDDYSFPEDAWDVRGWTVRTEADDSKVGKVDDMLLDSGGALRYLDVDLGLLKKHVLVPLSRAYADRDSEAVWIEGMTKRDLDEVPEYALDPETLDEAYERRLDTVYGGRTGTPRADADFDRNDVRGTERDVTRTERDAPPAELQRLGTLEDEYQVSGDDPRGWTVVTGDNRKVGKVAELLVEPGAMTARYLDTVVNEKDLGLEPVDRHVLIPLDRARLDRRDKKVVVSGLLGHDLADYPPYTGLPLSQDHMQSISRHFDRAGAGDEPRRSDPGEEPGSRSEWRDPSVRRFYHRSDPPRGRGVREED